MGEGGSRIGRGAAGKRGKGSAVGVASRPREEDSIQQSKGCTAFPGGLQRGSHAEQTFKNYLWGWVEVEAGVGVWLGLGFGLQLGLGLKLGFRFGLWLR